MKKIAKMLGKDFIEETTIGKLYREKSEEPFTLVIFLASSKEKKHHYKRPMGKELALINVTPETYTINEISFGHTYVCGSYP